MTRAWRVTMHTGAALAMGAMLLLIGAAGTYLLIRGRDPGVTAADSTPTAGDAASSADTRVSMAAPTPGRLPDVVVPFPDDAVARAGIAVAPVSMGSSDGTLRLPGVVQPNAYRQVVVTPLVAGRITRVPVLLGERVRRGQVMAQVYSPELAEAQTRYVAGRAMLDAHDRELQRTERLIEIGAASRQELERVHAEHAAQTAALESARTTLELLGAPVPANGQASGTDVNATTDVPAPIDGIVTERTANVGLNVDPATSLFTVVDLATVWVIADVYEQDFSRVRVGTEAVVTTPAYPELTLRGRISYVDPRVNVDTRTGQVRVEVPNARGDLRLGMYADVNVTAAGRSTVPMVSRNAVQQVGDRTVVYLANPQQPGTFIEREVRLGSALGEQVEVVEGVRPGDAVVTEGSFFVRAERERLGLGPAAGGTGATVDSGAEAAPAQRSGQPVQVVRIVVGEQGFEPATVTLRAGGPARITFVRTTDNTCGTEVVFPSLGIRRALPLDEPVPIEFTPETTGDIEFACGLNMFKGVVAVR